VVSCFVPRIVVRRWGYAQREAARTPCGFDLARDDLLQEDVDARGGHMGAKGEVSSDGVPSRPAATQVARDDRGANEAADPGCRTRRPSIVDPECA
jgi:hypothetical protein